MIIGIGTDIVQIPRIHALLEAQGPRFINRLLTLSEQEELQKYKGDKERLAAHIARRFAAKEAIAKAIGTGIGEAVGFHDIAISKAPSGQPVATISSKALLALKGHAKVKVLLSISDDYPAATAFAVITN